ncbi:hypothetical protein K2X30_13270 [bacterium]|jgi:hypothetical protein|nr:hypothetical protein [bacterium]
MHKYFAQVLVLLSACAHTLTYTPCEADSARQAKRSQELQDLVNADQADRTGPVEKIDMEAVRPRDIRRRIRVAEIFAEGCFKEAKDYAAAALVFQHGDVVDHYYQTFIWSKRAVELGDPTQRSMMAKGLDRYLVRTGKKQLFASQAGKDSPNPCWCLEPVEKSFPESRRAEYGSRSNAEAFLWVQGLNAEQSDCPKETKPSFCNHPLKPSPKGSVPGFW